MDAEGFPWALPGPHGRGRARAEGQRIEEAYPRFENRRVSGGTEQGDWYNYPGEPWEPAKAIVYVAGSYKSGLQDTVRRTEGRRNRRHPGRPVGRGALGSSPGRSDRRGRHALLRGVRRRRVRRHRRLLEERDEDRPPGGRQVHGDRGIRRNRIRVLGYYFDGLEYVAVYWTDDGAAVTRVDLSAGGSARATDISVSAAGAVCTGSGYYSDGTHDVAAYWLDSGAGPVRTGLLYTSGLSQANALALSGAGRPRGGTVPGRQRPGPRPGRTTRCRAPAPGFPERQRQGNHRPGRGTAAKAGDYLGTRLRPKGRDMETGSSVELTTSGGTGDNPSFANGLTVLDGDVYVAGVQGGQGFDQAVHWRNGTLEQLSPDDGSPGQTPWRRFRSSEVSIRCGRG
ncbi:MAG: hypothetical protein M0C28_37620 [Candidatus Moduliflexus flocculans]|nr:hypothetical protein [Candidatus Moduliflexus flocculans]